MSFGYIGDCEIIFSTNGISGGIRNVQLKGNLRIILKNFRLTFPALCGIEISFMEYPSLDYELTTALATLGMDGKYIFNIFQHFFLQSDMFSTGELIRSLIRDEIIKRLVFPKKFLIKLKKSCKGFIIPDLEGVIKVNVKSFDELTESFQEIHTNLKFGDQSVDNLKVRDESGKIDIECFFVCYSEGDRTINISLKESSLIEEENVEIFNSSIDVSNLDCEENFCEKFPLSPSGFLSVDLSWFTLSSSKNDFKNNHKNPAALLEVFIDSVRNISSEFLQNEIFVTVSVDEIVQQTAAEEAKSPVFKKHFALFIKDPKNKNLSVEVISENSSEILGHFEYKISDLIARKHMDHEFQAFPMVQSVQKLDILMSLRLRALKAPE